MACCVASGTIGCMSASSLAQLKRSTTVERHALTSARKARTTNHDSPTSQNVSLRRHRRARAPASARIDERTRVRERRSNGPRRRARGGGMCIDVPFDSDDSDVTRSDALVPRVEDIGPRVHAGRDARERLEERPRRRAELALAAARLLAAGGGAPVGVVDEEAHDLCSERRRGVGGRIVCRISEECGWAPSRPSRTHRGSSKQVTAACEPQPTARDLGRADRAVLAPAEERESSQCGAAGQERAAEPRDTRTHEILAPPPSHGPRARRGGASAPG